MFEEFEIRVVTAVTVVLNGFHKGGGVVGEIFLLVSLQTCILH